MNVSKGSLGFAEEMVIVSARHLCQYVRLRGITYQVPPTFPLLLGSSSNQA